MSLNELVLMLRNIREKSAWGQTQDLSTVLEYLRSEVDELTASIQKADRLNIAEEIGDTLMVSLFALITVEDTYKIPLENTLEKTCKKLERRYPYLFRNGNNQRIYTAESFKTRLEQEEMIWNREKNNQTLLEFCICTNPECKAFSKPGLSSLELIAQDINPIVKCTVCNSTFPLSVSLLFPDFPSDRNEILLAIIRYVKGASIEQAAASQKLSTETLRQCLELSCYQKLAVKRLLLERYGIEETEIINNL